MFVQVLIEKKRKRRRRRSKGKNAHLKRFIWLFSFFLAHTYTHDRCKIVEGNEEKSYCKPIASTYLANERCQRTTERERNKYQKMTEKQQQQQSILLLVDR